MLLYALTIALSAFLLFEVQPIIAKMILPWFGGSSAVWSTCMLFFQMVLLLGYGYAHWLHSRLTARRQAMVHITVLAASLATLPIIPNASWKRAAVGHPSLTILALPAALAAIPDGSTAPTWPVRFFWLSLAASPSVLLLAVTTHLTQDVADIPFLWIIPLSVYLLSFIICFEAPRWYRRATFVPLLA